MGIMISLSETFMSEMYKMIGSTSSKPWKQHTFNSFGDMFSIFDGSNSPFRRRRASNALFYQEMKERDLKNKIKNKKTEVNKSS
jgi:hypothetical protein